MANTIKQAFPVFNGYAPKQGPKALPVTLDFSEKAEQAFDLVLENTEGVIDYIQSIYVDNSDNPNTVEFIFGVTNQRLVVPAGAQGNWPVIAPSQTRIFTRSTVDPKARVNVLLMNVPMPYTQWGPQTVNVNPTISIEPYQGNPGNSFASNVPDAVTLVLAANANRKAVFLEASPNNVSGIEITIAGKMLTTLLPGAKWNSDFVVPMGDINAKSAIAGSTGELVAIELE